MRLLTPATMLAAVAAAFPILLRAVVIAKRRVYERFRLLPVPNHQADHQDRENNTLAHV